MVMSDQLIFEYFFVRACVCVPNYAKLKPAAW